MSETSLASSPAGPSSLHSTPSLPPPLPGALERDDYAAANQARERLNKRGFLSSVSLPLPHRKRAKSEEPLLRGIYSQGDDATTSQPPEVTELVDLAENLPSEVDGDSSKDVYRWAILYENQRGATVFSTAYYSPLTLLPLDPPPFTIPTATGFFRKNQPTVTLEDYPLPDGSWRWVSRAWMIDMRGDGEVQYDGFEYSRSFQSKKWGPSPGFMSNRGLVRRRRWIRLMMRPAQTTHDAESAVEVAGTLSVLPELEHHEEGATRPPSVIFTSSDDSSDSEAWKGDKDDWERCHLALRHLGRDGQKLELWARWLGISEGPATGSRPSSLNPIISPFVVALPQATESEKQISSGAHSTEDVASTKSAQIGRGKLAANVGVSLTQAHREYIGAVIRDHSSDILSLFVYPESRAQFLSLLGRSGLLPEIRGGLGISDSVQFLDFWSYTKNLEGTTDLFASS